MTDPAPHTGGLVGLTRSASVHAGGSPAAVMFDPVTCKAGSPNLIMMGSPNVHIEGFPAARKYDLTIHTGMILEGESTVLIGGDPPSVLLALAIMRIQNSEYGKTADGRKMVENLKKKLEDGSLSVQDLPPGHSGGHVKEDPAPGERAKPWDRKGNIIIDEDNLDDVDDTANTLVHEGKHAQGGGEIAAREEANKLHKEQKARGYDNPYADADAKAIEEKRLRQRLKDIGYDDGDL